MFAMIIINIIGIIMIYIGITNTKGNINSIHSYHRYKVSEKDKPIFSKLMGVGTIICGVGISIFSIFLIIEEFTKQSLFMSIGIYVIVISLVIGIGIMIYATSKYNKGIF